MSDTPRTDEAQYHPYGEMHKNDWIVDAQIARQLERELKWAEENGKRKLADYKAATRKELARLRAHIDKLYGALKTLHYAAGKRMMAGSESTADERLAFLDAWKATGNIIREEEGQ
jgi:hypothetical protein